MDRNELIFAITLLLFGAFLMGFLCHWAATRLSRVSKGDASDLSAMADALHQSEEAREMTLATAAAEEARYRARISQAEAELQSAMEGLRDARREVDELKAHLPQPVPPQS